MNIKKTVVWFVCMLSLLVVIPGCDVSGSSDAKEVLDESEQTKEAEKASDAAVFGIFSGIYDGKSAEFVCAGSDCVIMVGTAIYARGVFVSLPVSIQNARTVGFTANLSITEKVNGSGVLIPLTTSELVSFVFPAEGSTESIKMIKDGVASDIVRLPTYIVTFDHQNNDYSAVPVKAGGTLDLANPLYNSISKGHYSLMEWCLDRNGNTPAPNPLVVNHNLTLYAKWSMVVVAPPVVSLRSDGFAVSVAMPAGTEGFHLFQVALDGSFIADRYYRNKYNWEHENARDFSEPVVYPFVSAGETYYWYIKYHNATGYTSAVSKQFSVTPSAGLGEFVISNESNLYTHITDGKVCLNELPHIIGIAEEGVVSSFTYWELVAGNGWGSENWVFLSKIPTNILETIVPMDILPHLVNHPSSPFDFGSRFFMMLVHSLVYQGDNCYRVLTRTSNVYTYDTTPQWYLMPVEDESIEYTFELISGGVRIEVTSNPSLHDLTLVFPCSGAKNKRCSFVIPVTNVSSTQTEDIDGYIIGEEGQSWSGQDIPASESINLVVNDSDRYITTNPMLYIPLDIGCFEILNPSYFE